jgi:beta-N-acetylhexosaminidase
VIFTDDMEMKAIAAHRSVPDACVQAIDAGCDGVLVCSGSTDLQAATLEALIHAVEDERLPWSRVDDAFARQRRMKERFLSARQARPDRERGWRAVLGRESHAAIAGEMARFL